MLRERGVCRLDSNDRRCSGRADVCHRGRSAKALAQETPIILLDEPTAFLDFPSKVEMLQLLLRLSREAHKTIFLSTHDLELALQIADQVWLLDDNHVLHMGPPRALASDGTLPSYFAAKGIDFDPETLHFSIHASKV